MSKITLNDVVWMIGIIFVVVLVAWGVVAIRHHNQASALHDKAKSIQIVHVACSPNAAVRFRRFIRIVDYSSGEAIKSAKAWAERCAAR